MSLKELQRLVAESLTRSDPLLSAEDEAVVNETIDRLLGSGLSDEATAHALEAFFCASADAGNAQAQRIHDASTIRGLRDVSLSTRLRWLRGDLRPEDG